MAGLIRRGKKFYALYYVAKEQKRVCLHTESLQVAKEKKRQLESAMVRGDDNPLPTKTPTENVVAAYIDYMRSTKLERNVQRDLSYLRDAFGPICPALVLKNPKIRKSPTKTRRPPVSKIEVRYFEQIATVDISQYISAQVRAKGLAPKTANRYREILTRLFNWSMEQFGIRLPNDKNPAAKVERYTERAQRIRFLTLEQIVEQLDALKDYPQLQTQVALFIFAGVRREEALWLTHKDIDLKAGRYGMIRVQAKTVNGEYWESKTKVNRAIPISSRLRAYLDSYAPAKVDGGWFFPSPMGKRWDVDNFSQLLRRVNKQTALPWGCLDFRHTFGSQLAMKGESLYKISNLMGNSPEICRRHYAALIPEALADCVEF